VSFPSYQIYKDSGVPWLDDVPSHWDVKAVYRIASFNNDVLPEATSPEYEIEYIEISGVSATKGIVNTEILTFAESPSRARRKVLNGDILISTVRTYLRAIAPVDRTSPNLIASTGFCVVRA